MDPKGRPGSPHTGRQGQHPAYGGVGREHWSFLPVKPRRFPRRAERRMVPDARRQFHPGEPRRNNAAAQPARGQAHAHPPRHLRPHGPAADRGGGAALPRRRFARRLRQGRRPAARLAAVRRALGPLLARCRPLRRHEGRAAAARGPALPYAWTYRDYVIDAFNTDKPYNQFIVEQLAADRLVSAAQKTSTRTTRTPWTGRPPRRPRLPHPGQPQFDGQRRTTSSTTGSTSRPRPSSGSPSPAPAATTTSSTRSRRRTTTPSTASSRTPWSRSRASGCTRWRRRRNWSTTWRR